MEVAYYETVKDAQADTNNTEGKILSDNGAVKIFDDVTQFWPNCLE